MRARSKIYHIECFRCVACSRQLIPGDEFALRDDGLFCRADHDVVERASLASGDPLSPLHPARPLQMAGKPGRAGVPGVLPAGQPAWLFFSFFFTNRVIFKYVTTRFLAAMYRNQAQR